MAGRTRSEQRTSLAAELAQTNLPVCAYRYDVLPRVAHLLKGSTTASSYKGKTETGARLLKRAHREIVDTWAIPCLDGCSWQRKMGD